MKSILVICQGNICRSPMAQGLLAHALPKLEVFSAGLGAMVGAPADEMAVRLMDERGIDIRGHRAQQVTHDLCLRADLVLVMDTQQRQRLEELYPLACGRVFRLAEHSKQDIPDPYRKREKVFRQALAGIEAGAREWRSRIQKISGTYA